MDPNESKPKVRRGGSGGVEESRPSGARAESTGQGEQEAPGNGSEKLLRIDEEVSPEPNKGVCRLESVLPWPFQATQRVLEEWTHFFGRAAERNARAAGDLWTYPSVANMLRWQRDLVQSNAEDWLETSFAAFGASVRKVAHAQAASKTAAT